ncbi:MAG: ATP synthase subunit I [Gammaproteobacteria bacterium]
MAAAKHKIKKTKNTKRVKARSKLAPTTKPAYLSFYNRECNRLSGIQLACMLGITVFWLIIGGNLEASSAFFGCLAWIFPSMYFTKKVLRSIYPAELKQSPRALLRIFFLTELKKLALSMFLVFLCVRYLPITNLAFISGYIVAILSPWPWFLSLFKTYQKEQS